MDYEKKHKEEVVRATQLWECGNITRENLEYIFPELRESEDERISREITEFILTHRIDEPNDIEDTNSWLAWLEKQGEKPKKVSIWKHWKDGIAGNGEDKQIFLIKIGRVYSISSCLGCECDYIELSELDKLMREQGKPKWSEEDEKRIERICNFVWKNRKGDTDEIYQQEQDVDWLRTLKDRVEE